MNKDFMVLFLSVVVNTTGLVFFKYSMLKLAQHPEKSGLLHVILNPLTILAMTFMLGGMMAMGTVLKRMDLSTAMPISTALGFVLIGLVSWLIFKEHISPLKIAGFALLMLGSFLIAR
jgi:multidrug transporter EmrE-like cation transporter